ncbi:MAG TPA: preprotein translocase subunit SecY [Planctomycetota bacterium]|nr:preprotein translocase subunit SecY [Planctomycetota bacterium]
MNAKFLQLFRIPETRDKILVTLGLMLAYRVGFQIPIPGMNAEFLSKMAGGKSGTVFGVMNAFSGGAIGQTAIFSLGIMPYISASIIFSMLSKVSPKVEAVAKEGAAGQKKINQWTRLATVPIALLQATLVYTGLFRDNPDMIADGVDSGIGLFLLVVLSLTGGAMMVMWIGELITEYGVGNGASLIIMAGIIAVMPASIAQMVGDVDFYNRMLTLLGLWTVIVVVIVYITKGARRIPIQYARLTRGRRVYGGQRHYLPLKVNMAGVMPIIFASILFVIPGVLFSVVGWSTLEGIFTDPQGFVHIALYAAMIFAFCFFWNRLMFNPDEIADNLREHGSFIPGIRPGVKTSEFLASTLTRLTLAGAAFLTLIAVLPNFVTGSAGLNNSMAYFLGGTSVLIVVGVAQDMVDKLNAQLVMRNYDGFMKGGSGGGSGVWGGGA